MTARAHRNYYARKRREKLGRFVSLLLAGCAFVALVLILEGCRHYLIQLPR